MLAGCDGRMQGLALEKYIFWLLLGVTFCLPLLPTVATHLLELAVLLALADNVLAGRFKMALPVCFWLLLLFAALAAFSLWSSPDFAASFYNYKVLMTQYVFIYWLTVSYVKTSRQLYAVLAALLLASVIVSSYGIFQYFYAAPASAEWVDTEYFPELKNRVFSTLGNPNILASFLVTTIALCMGGILASDNDIVRGLLVLPALLGAVCLVFTFSRGAWVSIVAILLLAGFLRI